jgi:hypothetical protein
MNYALAFALFLFVSPAHSLYADISHACLLKQSEQVFMYTDHSGMRGRNVSGPSNRFSTDIDPELARRGCRRGAVVVAHCHLDTDHRMLLPSSSMPEQIGGDIEAAYVVEQFCAAARYPETMYPPLRHIIVVPELRVYVEFILPQDVVERARQTARLQFRAPYGVQRSGIYHAPFDHGIEPLSSEYYDHMYELGGSARVQDAFLAKHWNTLIPIGPIGIILRELPW